MTTKKTPMSEVSFVFFGTGEIAAIVLEELLRAGLYPSLVVTAPDKPSGRGMSVAASAVSILADRYHLSVEKSRAIDGDFLADLKERSAQLFVVADYGTILPQTLLDIPEKGTLNMHPSLLPRLRGPSPIRSAILRDEKDVGVSVMLLDAKMDHGPLLAQKKVSIAIWPPRGKELDSILAQEGGALLSQVLPLWIAGEIEARAQNHDLATYSKLFTKEDGLLDFAADPYQNFLKIRAFEGWPGTFAFFERAGNRIRAQIIDAHLEGASTSPGKGNKLVIDTIKPEGKREMAYEEFLRSGARPAKP